MRKSLVAIIAAVGLLGGALATSVGPVSAASTVTATSVALTGAASCSNVALDIGLVSGTVDTQSFLATDLAGTELEWFLQAAVGLSDQDGVVDNLGDNVAPQPDGTVIGAYFSVGVAPLTAASAAEWFVLYRCGTPGNNIVLSTCFGDVGTCPTTAVEAAELLFDATVSPAEVAPGGTLTVTATDCLYPLGGAVLLRDGVGLGVGDSTTVDPDGSFTIDLVVPADTTPGPLTVQVDCGFDGQTVLSLDLDASVSGGSSPTTGATPPPANAPVASPRFTG